MSRSHQADSVPRKGSNRHQHSPEDGVISYENWTVPSGAANAETAMKFIQERVVPVHLELIELGFLDFVAARRKADGEQAWLFPTVSPDQKRALIVQYGRGDMPPVADALALLLATRGGVV